MPGGLGLGVPVSVWIDLTYIKGTLPKFIINPTPMHLAETGDGVMGFRWEKWGAGAAEMMFCLSESFYRGEVGPQVELL